MKLIDSIFGAKADHQPITGDFGSFVRISIPIIGTEGGTMDDPELIRRLISEGIPEQEAVEIVLFAPVAFARRLILNVTWPDHYMDCYSDGRKEKRFYKENPRYKIIETEAEQFSSISRDKDLLLNVASRSAEFKVVKELLLEGSKPEVIELAPANVTRQVT